MFYIIGIGLNPKQMTLEAKQAIDDCEEVYIDNYTNIFSNGNIRELEEIINKKVIKLNRAELEQEQKFIKDKSCLLVIGNALSATTHYSILQDAKKKGINAKVIPGISIFNYKGAPGLYEYRFGQVVSIVFSRPNFHPTSFFNKILDNLKINTHTMCLMDIIVEENRFMKVTEACEILESIDKEKVLENRTCVALGAMGSENQEIVTFDFKDYKNIKINGFPQTLIICANLNEFERVGVNEYRN